MKKISMLILSSAFVFSLVSCGGESSNPTEAPTEIPTEAPSEVPSETTIRGTYIGTVNNKDSKGRLVGGHLVNFYEDNSLQIVGTVSSNKIVNKKCSYKGTYSMSNDLDISMKYKSTLSEQEDSYNCLTKLSTGLFDSEFRAGLIANDEILDDGTDPDEPGLTYYSIPEIEVSDNLLMLCIATDVIDDMIHAYALQLYNDYSFKFSYRKDEEASVLPGTFQAYSDGTTNGIELTFIEGSKIILPISNGALSIGVELDPFNLPLIESCEVYTGNIKN